MYLWCGVIRFRRTRSVLVVWCDQVPENPRCVCDQVPENPKCVCGQVPENPRCVCNQVPENPKCVCVVCELRVADRK